MTDRISPMGCHRALTAMDLAEAARRRGRAMSARNADLRQSAKDAAWRTLAGLRDLRLIIGEHGYRLP